MAVRSSGARLRRLSLALLLLAGGCTGAERLSEAMGTINREYGELQDQALLLNILRRSLRLPAHFTALTTIRGRNRVSAGANLTLPFGAEAPSRITLNPNVSVESGPNFEVSTQENREFFRGYLTPVGATTTHLYLQQAHPAALVLSLLIERIRLRDRDGRDRLATNTPDQPNRYHAFQAMLEALVDQGLTTEEVELVRDVGPELDVGDPIGVDQLLAARDKGLAIEEVTAGPGPRSAASGRRRYRLRQVSPSARFCFRQPTAPPFVAAQCGSRAGAEAHRFRHGDGHFFGTNGGAIARLDAGAAGTLELHTRSLAEIMDYLGLVARMQLDGGAAPTIRTASGREALLVVTAAPAWAGPHAVAITFGGQGYAIPAGRAGGQSGAVLTIVSQLLAQAQSVRDLPASNAVTIVGD